MHYSRRPFLLNSGIDTMSFFCIACDRSFDSDANLKQHKRTSVAHAFNCIPCNRHFDSKAALQQHLRDKPAHIPSFSCNDCNRPFDSEDALQQHLWDLPAHAPSFKCDECNRPFNSKDAFQQHLRISPAHAPSFNCNECNRPFNNKDAFKRHLRDSPAHAPSFYCGKCNRSFDSEDAFKQHVRDSIAQASSFHCGNYNRSLDNEDASKQHVRSSLAQAPSFNCSDCNRPFNTKYALQQHIRDSPNHQQHTETPMDIFFRSFSTFQYDPSLSPATSYANLRRHEGWRRGDFMADDAWNGYQDALQNELKMWYGEEDDLTAWHVLCRAIGVKPLPKTCERCKQAVQRSHVNIVDLIEWGRNGSEDNVETFRDLHDLRTYTLGTGKIFRNTFNQASSNVVLRHLLRKIF